MKKKIKNVVRNFAKQSKMRTTPVGLPRSVRTHVVQSSTTTDVGLFTPIGFMPLLREDSLQASKYRFAVQMRETSEFLMNAMNVRVSAFLVPFSAFDRYTGMDDFNRSYTGQPEADGEVIPFIVREVYAENPIYKKLGIHAPVGAQVNDVYKRAYNAIWNNIAKNTSSDILLRNETDDTLAPAFTNLGSLSQIVPDFDESLMEGEVPLNLLNAKMPVTGIGVDQSNSFTSDAKTVKETGGDAPIVYNDNSGYISRAYTNTKWYVREDPDNAGFPGIFAELEDNGISVSLANLEAVKKTQAMAKLRSQYDGHDDEYIIDLLMQNIRTPEISYREPIMLGSKSVNIDMMKRYSGDSTDLTASYADGAAMVEMTLATPSIPTGGVVMFIAEIQPEVMHERQACPLLMATDVIELPRADRDILDTQPITVVKNQDIDISHSDPNGTFGYRALNTNWHINTPRLGGEFYRNTPSAPFNENRNRIWTTDITDIAINEDWYLTNQVNSEPLVTTTQEGFEVFVGGVSRITGNTVFGSPLIPTDGNYEAIEQLQDNSRIEKE